MLREGGMSVSAVSRATGSAAASHWVQPSARQSALASCCGGLAVASGARLFAPAAEHHAESLHRGLARLGRGALATSLRPLLAQLLLESPHAQPQLGRDGRLLRRGAAAGCARARARHLRLGVGIGGRAWGDGAGRQHHHRVDHAVRWPGDLRDERRGEVGRGERRDRGHDRGRDRGLDRGRGRRLGKLVRNLGRTGGVEVDGLPLGLLGRLLAMLPRGLALLEVLVVVGPRPPSGLSPMPSRLYGEALTDGVDEEVAEHVPLVGEDVRAQRPLPRAVGRLLVVGKAAGRRCCRRTRRATAERQGGSGCERRVEARVGARVGVVNQ